MSRCYVSPSTSRDLNEISDYFLTQNLEAGERLLKEFTKKCESLMQFPNLGRSYEWLRVGMRGVPLDGYIIFYQVVNDGIEILRVVGGRQDLQRVFNDES